MESEKLRQKIIELTDCDPVDMFGEIGWELYAEEWIEQHKGETFNNKFGRE